MLLQSTAASTVRKWLDSGFLLWSQLKLLKFSSIERNLIRNHLKSRLNFSSSLVAVLSRLLDARLHHMRQGVGIEIYNRDQTNRCALDSLSQSERPEGKGVKKME